MRINVIIKISIVMISGQDFTLKASLRPYSRYVPQIKQIIWCKRKTVVLFARHTIQISWRYKATPALLQAHSLNHRPKLLPGSFTSVVVVTLFVLRLIRKIQVLSSNDHLSQSTSPIKQLH